MVCARAERTSIRMHVFRRSAGRTRWTVEPEEESLWLKTTLRELFAQPLRKQISKWIPARCEDRASRCQQLDHQKSLTHKRAHSGASYKSPSERPKTVEYVPAVKDSPSVANRNLPDNYVEVTGPVVVSVVCREKRFNGLRVSTAPVPCANMTERRSRSPSRSPSRRSPSRRSGRVGFRGNKRRRSPVICARTSTADRRQEVALQTREKRELREQATIDRCKPMLSVNLSNKETTPEVSWMKLDTDSEPDDWIPPSHENENPGVVTEVGDPFQVTGVTNSSSMWQETTIGTRHDKTWRSETWAVAVAELGASVDPLTGEKIVHRMVDASDTASRSVKSRPSLHSQKRKTPLRSFEDMFDEESRPSSETLWETYLRHFEYEDLDSLALAFDKVADVEDDDPVLNSENLEDFFLDVGYESYQPDVVELVLVEQDMVFPMPFAAVVRFMRAFKTKIHEFDDWAGYSPHEAIPLVCLVQCVFFIGVGGTICEPIIILGARLSPVPLFYLSCVSIH